MQTKAKKLKNLNFRDYYNSLTESEKSNLIQFFVPKYMAIATFYYKMRTSGWSEYDYEKMEELTGKNFRP
jgi:hypothetical protein